ncbi:hypothetical protein C1H46_003422 [Malus baccata]|uniref:Uncharacterized protein n=1 Tax=Malus baccata TaxID=106549 RepID=A0A540NIX7_MALBA|nr:hypothetical protein C1H46_003422 [Malus baccata]
MSQLIRSRKAVTTTPCPNPPPSTAAAAAPTKMDPRLVNLINVLADIYVRPEDELTESLHGEEPIGSLGVRFPEHVDRVCGFSRGWGVSHPYKDLGLDPRSEALSSFDIYLPNIFAPPTSEPFHPEHTQQLDPSTSDLILYPDPVPNPDLRF